MISTRKSKITYLKPEWAEAFPLCAGFSTRNGGVSRPPFNSLNLGFGTDDQVHNVEGNRSTFCRAFDISPRRLLTVKQVHGTDLLIIDEPNPDLFHFLNLECDAIITNQPGIMLGILVADCYPVLFYDPTHGVVAAAHIGWRGAAGRLIKKVLCAFCSLFECVPADLYCAVGAGISAKHYEVDREVRDEFQRQGHAWEKIAVEKTYGRWNLDIGTSCLVQMEEEGVPAGHIAQADYCTFAKRELFFSYRRDNGQTGRQMGFIMLQ
jgi:hypothetical protein